MLGATSNRSIDVPERASDNPQIAGNAQKRLVRGIDLGKSTAIIFSGMADGGNKERGGEENRDVK